MHVNQTKWRENDVCWRLILFYPGTCCIPLVLWLSIATFNDTKPRLKVVSCSVNEFVVNTNPTCARRVTPPWNTYVARYDPRWEGYTDWLACENSRFSSLFAAEDVSRGITYVPPRETSPAAKSEEKRLFSQATDWQTGVWKQFPILQKWRRSSKQLDVTMVASQFTKNNNEL